MPSSDSDFLIATWHSSTWTNSSSQKSKSGGGIVEVVDEILSRDPNAGGLSIHWQEFGSNGLEKADYSRGVLDRFTRRAKKNFYGSFKDSKGIIHTLGNVHLKIVANPRYIKETGGPHYAVYFEGFHSVDENCKPLAPDNFSLPIVADKIAINHYRCKSKEEFTNKLRRGYPTNYAISAELFTGFDNNDEFDDDILKYRAERAKVYQPPDKSHTNERLFNALAKNLSPTLLPNTPQDFYAGKMETFLTCRAVASYLKTKLADDEPAKFFEEASLKAILKSVNGMTFADARLLIRELPNLLGLQYPVAKDLRIVALNIIPSMLNVMRVNGMWKDYAELDYIQDLLKLGG